MKIPPFFSIGLFCTVVIAFYLDRSLADAKVKGGVTK